MATLPQKSKSDPARPASKPREKESASEENGAKSDIVDMSAETTSQETANQEAAGQDFKNLEASSPASSSEPEPKRLPTMDDKIRERHGHITAKNLAKELLSDAIPAMLQSDRVKNRAMPSDPSEVFDWPTELAYMWVPAPGGTRPLLPEQEFQLDEFVRQGWRFYPADLMAHSPGARGGLPWKMNWEAHDSKVRWGDMWLVYRARDYNDKVRRENIRKKKERSQRDHGTGRHYANLGNGQGYDYVVQEQEGSTTALQALRESKGGLDRNDVAWDNDV